eukprot:SAG22_NODE_1911_length_3328_cov_2.473521_4_plen_539_part_00
MRGARRDGLSLEEGLNPVAPQRQPQLLNHGHQQTAGAGVAGAEKEPAQKLVIAALRHKRARRLLWDETSGGLRPTRLARAAELVIVGVPACLCLDAAAGISGKRPPGNVIFALWFLLAGLGSFQSLCAVTKPGSGELAVLGAGAAHIPRAAEESLQKWSKITKGVGVLFSLPGMMILLLMVLPADIAEGNVAGAMWGLFVAAYLPAFAIIFCSWWMSLKQASTLVSVRLAKVAAAAEHAAADGLADELIWRADVEGPVLAIGGETLPTLSSGWGRGLGLVAAGFAGGAVGLTYLCWSLGLYDPALWSGTISRSGWYDPAFLAVIAVPTGMGMVPLLLGGDPAALSSRVSRLTERLNSIQYRDIKAHPLVFPLMFTRQSANRGQGAGFVVFGAVVTKRTMWLVASALRGAVFTLGPLLAGDAAAAGMGSSGRQHGSCPFGWEYSDGDCFKLVAQHLDWNHAEEACQKLGPGTHLASITSAEQQAAVEHLVKISFAGYTVWIGLNDMDQEGSFVWADGEPDTRYTHWSTSTANPNGDVRI